MKSIDKIFQNSAYETRLEVSDKLWERVQSELDKEAMPENKAKTIFFTWQKLSIAASIALLVGFLTWKNTSQNEISSAPYVLEELTANTEDPINHEVIATMYDFHASLGRHL